MEPEEKQPSSTSKVFLGVAVIIVFVIAIFGSALTKQFPGLSQNFQRLFPQAGTSTLKTVTQKQVLTEESVTIDIAKNVSPSVVTVAIVEPKRDVVECGSSGCSSTPEGGQQDIGTGFIVDQSGLIVTNKHVVSVGNVSYKVVTKDNKEYSVTKIYRDPANDIALLKIDPSTSGGAPTTGQVLQAVTLGDSDQIQVGQYVAAIGTALGQFRQSITTGVVSGIGRSIQAGSGNPFEGYAEQLDNVIQTDAAINPGNSGGPLLDSSARVIGVNVAVAEGAQSVGFALPINVVKSSIDQFHQTGEFSRPFLGVQYQMVTQRAAIVNEIPQGALVEVVVPGSSADRAGIKKDDIIVKFGGEKVGDSKTGLAQLVNKRKVGETVQVDIWRDGKTLTLAVTLTEATQ